MSNSPSFKFWAGTAIIIVFAVLFSHANTIPSIKEFADFRDVSEKCAWCELPVTGWKCTSDFTIKDVCGNLVPSGCTPNGSGCWSANCTSVEVYKINTFNGCLDTYGTKKHVLEYCANVGIGKDAFVAANSIVTPAKYDDIMQGKDQCIGPATGTGVSSGSASKTDAKGSGTGLPSSTSYGMKSFGSSSFWLACAPLGIMRLFYGGFLFSTE